MNKNHTPQQPPERLPYDEINVDSPYKIYDWFKAIRAEIDAIAAWNYKHKNLAIQDGAEAYHLGKPGWITGPQMRAITRNDRLNLERYLVIANGDIDDLEKPTTITAYQHWNDREWWSQECDDMFDYNRVPDDGVYYTIYDAEANDCGPYEDNYSYTADELERVAERYSLRLENR